MLVTEPKRLHTYTKKNDVVQSFSFVNFVHRTKFDYVTHRTRDKDLCVWFFLYLSTLSCVSICLSVSCQWNRRRRRRLSNKGNNPFIERANMF